MYTNIIRQMKKHEGIIVGVLYYSMLEANRYRTKTK